MKDTSIRELFHQPPTETLTDVSVSGWVRTVRDSKAFGFIELNDGTYFKNLQIVLEDGKTADFANALKVTLGSAIRAKGDLVPTPGMKQPFELKAKEIEVVGLCSPDYPLQKKRHSFEYLRTIAHLRPRTNTFYAVFRIRSLAAQLLHAFFAERGFVYVHTPLITTSDCEGAGEMFQVTTLPLENVPKTESGEVDYSQDFFCKPANLTVSGTNCLNSAIELAISFSSFFFSLFQSQCRPKLTGIKRAFPASWRRALHPFAHRLVHLFQKCLFQRIQTFFQTLVIRKIQAVRQFRRQISLGQQLLRPGAAFAHLQRRLPLPQRLFPFQRQPFHFRGFVNRHFFHALFSLPFVSIKKAALRQLFLSPLFLFHFFHGFLRILHKGHLPNQQLFRG